MLQDCEEVIGHREVPAEAPVRTDGSISRWSPMPNARQKLIGRTRSQS
jgi:hypothetical protein